MTIISPPGIRWFEGLDGRRLAIRHRPPATREETLLFLPGYASDMDGSKAVSIDAHCAMLGMGCLRFDYSGTGLSEGRFEDGTLKRWLDEALAVAKAFAPGPLIVAGSSMGGWIALLLALRRTAEVRAILGIAAAPDFTDWGYDQADKDQMARDGFLDCPNPYGPEAERIWLDFWKSGESLRLLDGPIEFGGPVRLVHGDADAQVPPPVALRLVERLRSSDVQLTLIKGGGHRLSGPAEIRAILRSLDDLVELIA